MPQHPSSPTQRRYFIVAISVFLFSGIGCSVPVQAPPNPPTQTEEQALFCWTPPGGLACTQQEINNELTALNNTVTANAAAWANGCGVAMCTGSNDVCTGSGWGYFCNTCQAICGNPGNCRFINSCIYGRIGQANYPCLRISQVLATCGKDHQLILVKDNCNNPLEYIDGWACYNGKPTIAPAGTFCYTYWLGNTCKPCSADCSCYGAGAYCVYSGGNTTQCYDSLGNYAGEPCSCGTCS